MLGTDIVKCVAIGGLVTVAIVSTYLGYDGAIIGTVMAIIGGIAGYELKIIKNK